MVAPKVRIGHEFAGRFRVERLLAEGGMGVLYAVTHLATGKLCALKVLNAEGCFDEEVRRRFLDEARNTPSDESDHIVRVFDAGVFEGVPWMLMELLEGATLAQHCERHGPLSLDALSDVFRQLCHGLAAAHRKGVVHRDLKPDNVFLQLPRNAHGKVVVKVLDFGVAKLLHPSQTCGNASVVVGSVGWWAPEQRLGSTVSPATDVWALGLLAYWCLTGRMFHELVDVDAVGATASFRAWQQGVGGRVPAALDSWFARCLALDPSARFPYAEEAWRALEAALLGCGSNVPWAPTLTLQPAPLPMPSVPPPAPRGGQHVDLAASAPADAVGATPCARGGTTLSLVSVPLSVRLRTGTRSSLGLRVLGGLSFVLGAALAVGWLTKRADEWMHGATAPHPGVTATSGPSPEGRTSFDERPLSTQPGVEAFLQQWNTQLDAMARRHPASLGTFYAEQTRLRGSRNVLRTRAGVEAYWRMFFYEQQGTISFDWGRAMVVTEVLDTTRESHSACQRVWADDPTVTLVRVPAVEDNPQSAIETLDGTRCTHIAGVYLLRMMRVGDSWQICHDTWSLEEAICPSCPSARSCRR